jgi:hypothetical protein
VSVTNGNDHLDNYHRRSPKGEKSWRDAKSGVSLVWDGVEIYKGHLDKADNIRDSSRGSRGSKPDTRRHEQAGPARRASDESTEGRRAEDKQQAPERRRSSGHTQYTDPDRWRLANDKSMCLKEERRRPPPAKSPARRRSDGQEVKWADESNLKLVSFLLHNPNPPTRTSESRRGARRSSATRSKRSGRRSEKGKEVPEVD